MQQSLGWLHFVLKKVQNYECFSTEGLFSDVDITSKLSILGRFKQVKSKFFRLKQDFFHCFCKMTIDFGLDSENRGFRTLYEKLSDRHTEGNVSLTEIV